MGSWEGAQLPPPPNLLPLVFPSAAECGEELGRCRCVLPTTSPADFGLQDEGLVGCSMLPEVVQKVLVENGRFTKSGTSMNCPIFFSIPTW